MASPFLTDMDSLAHSTMDDHYGDGHLIQCANHVAGMLVIAGAFLVFLKVSGFRAMVGVGRG